VAESVAFAMASSGVAMLAGWRVVMRVDYKDEQILNGSSCVIEATVDME
jgi:hypothetical protein